MVTWAQDMLRGWDSQARAVRTGRLGLAWEQGTQCDLSSLGKKEGEAKVAKVRSRRVPQSKDGVQIVT